MDGAVEDEDLLWGALAPMTLPEKVKLRGAPACCRGAASLVDQSWISRTAETACVFQSQITRSSVVGDCAAAPATPTFPLVPDPLPQPRLPMSSACRLGPVQSNLGFSIRRPA